MIETINSIVYTPKCLVGLKKLQEMGIRRGNFVLHSGGKTNVLIDVLTVREYFNDFMKTLIPKYTVVGIELGGTLLAYAYDKKAGIVRKDGYFYPPQSLKGPKVISLCDDVVSTGQSFYRAAEILERHGYIIGERLVVIDRRSEDKRELMNIKSLAVIEDIIRNDVWI